MVTGTNIPAGFEITNGRPLPGTQVQDVVKDYNFYILERYIDLLIMQLGKLRGSTKPWTQERHQITKATCRMKKMNVGMWKLKPVNISLLSFADDLVLFGKTEN